MATPKPGRRDGLRPRVATFGNFTIDSVTTHEGRRAIAVLGGDCVYAAVGARVWGAAVRAVGVVGQDYPEQWLQQLRDGGVGTECVRRVASEHALIAPMNYDERGRRENERERLRLPDPAHEDFGERWRLFSPTVEDAKDCRLWADCIHLAAMPVDRQNDLLRYFAGSKVITLDIPWTPDAMQPLELPDIRLASAIFLSDAELMGHFGDLSDDQAVRLLIDRGARLIVTKHGKRGSVVYRADDPRPKNVPAIETEVVDPTGAGDAYCGGFAVGFWTTGNPLTAALCGTVSASFIIEGFSAGHALSIEREQARDRLQTLRQRVEGMP